MVKDLTDQLTKAEAKDRFYEIELEIERLLASPHYQRPFQYVKGGWGEIKRVETITDGAPEATRAPQRRVRGRKGESETKVGECWTFKYTQKNGEAFDPKQAEEKDWKNVEITIPWGTNYGVFKSALRRSLEAQKRLRYEAAPLSLIKIYPLWLNVGKAPAESMAKGRTPEVILQTRHTQRGDVMVEVFFDFIENRTVKFWVEIDSEAPINEEKFVALIKTLNTLDAIGPTKRGSFKVLSVKQVKPTDEELQTISAIDEPVMPVVY